MAELGYDSGRYGYGDSGHTDKYFVNKQYIWNELRSNRAAGKTGRVQAEQQAAREQCDCSNRHRSVQFA